MTTMYLNIFKGFTYGANYSWVSINTVNVHFEASHDKLEMEMPICFIKIPLFAKKYNKLHFLKVVLDF